MEKIRTQLKINGKLRDVEIENGEITMIDPEQKVTDWEYAEENYSIDTIGKIFESVDCMNKARYDNANLFSNKQLAENISRMQALQRKMFRWQAENDMPIDKEHSTARKYYLYYNIDTKTINVDYYCSSDSYVFSPLFSSYKKAKECLDIFKEEFLWLCTEFKWRMDM